MEEPKNEDPLRTVTPASPIIKNLDYVINSDAFTNMSKIVLIVDVSLLSFPSDLGTWSGKTQFALILYQNSESALKILGLGVNSFFSSGWNCADLILDILALVTFIDAPALAALRGLKLMRVTRIFRGSHKFPKLTNSFRNLSQMTNW